MAVRFTAPVHPPLPVRAGLNNCTAVVKIEREDSDAHMWVFKLGLHNMRRQRYYTKAFQHSTLLKHC